MSAQVKFQENPQRTGLERRLEHEPQGLSPREGETPDHAFIIDYSTNPLMYRGPEEASIRRPGPEPLEGPKARGCSMQDWKSSRESNPATAEGRTKSLSLKAQPEKRLLFQS